MSAPLTVDSLAEMFPALSIATVQDVVEQCGNNCEVALEGLLAMTSNGPSPAGSRQLAQPPPPPTNMQNLHAMLFPAEKSPPKASPPQPASPPSFTGSNLTALTNTTMNSGQEAQASVGLEDVCPWLVSLDTGQVQGTQEAAVANPLVPAPGLSQQLVATSRGWWPRWPLHTEDQGHERSRTVGGLCRPVGSGPSPPGWWGGGPLHGPPGQQHPAGPGEWSPADHLLDSGKYCTPPRGLAAAAPSGGRNIAATFDAHIAGSSSHAGVEASDAIELASASLSEDEQLAEMMPYLAHCLGSPSLSGTSSPALVTPAAAASARLSSSRAAAPPPSGLRPMPSLADSAAAEAEEADRRLAVALPLQLEAQQEAQQMQLGEQPRQQQPQQQEGYSAEDLVAAVDFHLQMFPNLKREVVGDVLQRYSTAPQTALDQLIMLSSCVEDAAAAAEGASSASEAPDVLGWEYGSGGGSVGSDDEQGNRAGCSWERGLTAAELAAIEHGIFPADLQPAAQRPSSPPAQAAAEGGLLSAEEKLAQLRAGFSAVSADEASAALAACDGSLFAAAELLRAFEAENKASAVGSSGSSGIGLNGGMLPEPASSSGSSSGVPQHARLKVQHLARRFQDAPTESLQVALLSSNVDLAMAQRTLQEAGYSKVPQVAVPGPPPPPGLPLPRPVPLQPSAPPLPAAGAGDAVPAGMTLSEATHLRNQSIFEQERAHAQRLQQCYRRCFELAADANARGDRAMADDLRMQGEQYRQQYDEERRRASRRISMRVNQRGGPGGTGLPLIPVDLHGKYVDEALEMVEAGVRSLPESIPGGVVVRYITGKGLHSAGGAARIKPEVIRLLSERGVPFVEGPGWVEATLTPAAH